MPYPFRSSCSGRQAVAEAVAKVVPLGTVAVPLGTAALAPASRPHSDREPARNKGIHNTSYRDYIGIMFPYSLLTTSKSRLAKLVQASPVGLRLFCSGSDQQSFH